MYAIQPHTEIGTDYKGYFEIEGNYLMCGKGDGYRPVKKPKYDRNYLRVFGDICECCNGVGAMVSYDDDGIPTAFLCPECNGYQFVEKSHDRT
jgi:hypothetical protein